MLVAIIKFIGVVLFLYLTWRNLREDYDEKKLVSYSWLAMLGMVLGGRIIYGIVHWGVFNENIIDWVTFFSISGFNYIGGIVCLFLISWWACRYNDWKIWAFFEDITSNVCLLLTCFWLADYTKNIQDWRMLSQMLVMMGGVVLANFIATKYRSFVWYSSGKKGFVFFFVVFVTSLVMTLIALTYKDRLNLVIFYLSISLLSGSGLFMLGEVFNNIFNFRRNK